MENPTELKHYDLRPEAEMDMQILLKSGIEVEMKPVNLGVFEGNLISGPVKLFVPAHELERARKIISGK